VAVADRLQVPKAGYAYRHVLQGIQSGSKDVMRSMFAWGPRATCVARARLDKAKELTGIGPEKRTRSEVQPGDGQLSRLLRSGPVMEVDGKTHGKLSSAETANVLSSYE